jgi:hypothetical protein
VVSLDLGKDPNPVQLYSDEKMFRCSTLMQKATQKKCSSYEMPLCLFCMQGQIGNTKAMVPS